MKRLDMFESLRLMRSTPSKKMISNFEQMTMKSAAPNEPLKKVLKSSLQTLPCPRTRMERWPVTCSMMSSLVSLGYALAPLVNQRNISSIFCSVSLQSGYT